MPELPEVETVRRRLEPVLAGRRLERVEILDPRLTRPEDPLEVATELVGERVEAVDRRGKYLVVRFESGRALLVHLRMTGSLLHVEELPDEDPHRRAVVERKLAAIVLKQHERIAVEIGLGDEGTFLFWHFPSDAPGLREVW